MENCHKSRSERRQGCQTRLARIEGQVRGLQKMIDEDRYCIDILTQTKAVISAIQRVEGELLKDHIDHCLTDAIMSGDMSAREEKIAELVDLLSKR